MSFFAVTIEEISSIRPHQNADRLMVASLKGAAYQFVVGRDTWKVGDKCLYFPLDAILPVPILQALGVEGKLAGSKRNRIKTVKIRGEISQGLIGTLALIDQLPESERTPEQITKFLGVTKYEPEIEAPGVGDASRVDLPEGVGVYDIENAERFPDAVKFLMENPVYISEKLEGSHFAVALINGVTYVCQRRFALEPIADKPLHFFLELTDKLGLRDLIKDIASELKVDHLVLRGESLGPGIQSNIYRLTERTARFYDVMADKRYLDGCVFRALFEKRGRADLLVPVLSSGATLAEWLGGRTLAEASNGKSELYDTQREGIVIRPMKESYNIGIDGRVILKQISPEYLAG